jgi:hypothetical protein
MPDSSSPARVFPVHDEVAAEFATRIPEFFQLRGEAFDEDACRKALAEMLAKRFPVDGVVMPISTADHDAIVDHALEEIDDAVRSYTHEGTLELRHAFLLALAWDAVKVLPKDSIPILRQGAIGYGAFIEEYVTNAPDSLDAMQNVIGRMVNAFRRTF